MKKILLPPTNTSLADAEQLTWAIEKAKSAGYTQVFTPKPQAWQVDNLNQLDVKNIEEMSWRNSNQRETVVFLLRSTQHRGYHVCEFDPPPDLSD